MKKFMLFLLILSFIGGIRAQEVTIGSGTSSSYSLAFYQYYEDSWWESLYQAAEVGMNGNITSISLEHDGGGTLQCENVRIYMGHRSQSSYTSTSAWTPMSDLTLVYSGTNTSIGGTSAGWETFTLSTPFFYNGTDNLVVVFAKHANEYSDDFRYYYTETENYSSLYRYLDEDETYSLHPGTASGSRSYNRPNIKLNITLDPNFCGSVNNLQVTGVTTDAGTVSWTPGFNPQSYIVEVKTTTETWDSPNVMTYTTSDTFQLLTGLSASSSYDIRVANNCVDNISTYRTISFLTLCGPTSNLPIEENFDSFTHTSNNGNILPNCWDYLNTGTSSSDHPTVYYASNNANSGSYSLRFYTSGGNNNSGYADQYAFLPPLDVTSVNIADLSLGLYMRRQGNSGTFRIVVGVTEGTDLSTFVSVDTLSTNSGTYSYKEVSFSNYSGNGNCIVLKAFKPNSGNNRGHVDDLILGTNLCATPSGLAVTDADEYSITLQWTENGTASSWQIEYGPVGFTTGNGTTVTANDHPYTISGLTPATTYEFQIRSDCGGNTSDWTSNRVTASTSCLSTTIPITEDFDTYTHTSNPNNGNGTNNLPNCWDAINTGSNYSAYPYVYYSNNNAYSGSYSLRFYTSNSNNYADQYAVLPVIDASTPLNNLQVSLKARANAANTPFTLIVGAISGAANTFEPIDTLTISGTSYSTYIVYFDAYDGTANRIALKAPKNSGNSNNRGYVDDIMVNQLSNCRMVSDVTFSNITTSEATVTWQSHGDESAWIIEYKATGDTEWQTDFASTNPHTLTGLTNATSYQVKVMADCVTEQSEATAIRTFTTNTCDTTEQCAYSFVLTDSYGDGWNGASISIRQNNILVSTIQAIDHNESSTTTVDTVHVMLCDNIPVSLSWTSGSYDDECSFQVIDPSGESIYTVSNPSSGTLTTFTPSCVVSDCPRPASITVSEIGATTATVSWSSTGTETVWNVEYRPVGGSTWTVEPTTDNPYYLYGLTPSTQYEIRVQTDCGDEVSAYRDGFFATAGCEPENQCIYEFVLTDSYGDGWNEAALTVRQNGITLTTMTLESGETTATFQVMLCDSHSTSLVWTSGSFDSECSFDVYNPNDSLIYTANSFSSGTMFTFTSSCAMPDCPRPTSLTVTDIESTSVTIGWTTFGTTAGVWNIEYKPANSSNWILESAYSSPYVLMGLTPATAYDIRIQSDCGDEVSNWREGSFTTMACETTDQCAFTFSLADSYGDGWNGAAIEVKQNNIVVATVTIPSSTASSTQQVSLCDNADIILSWISGNFDSECSFTVTDPFGEVFYTSGNLSSGTLTTFTAHCTPPTCPRPSSISVTASTTSTATVNWVSSGTEDAWNIEYKPADSDTWTTEAVTTNPYTLTGLNGSTTYEVRVQADCGYGDVSDWRATVFQTQCEIFMLPYSENFDSYTGTTYDDANGIAPNCWTTQSNNTTYGTPHITSSGNYHYTNSGTNCMVFTCGSSGADAYAALPSFDEPLNTLSLNFWRAMESTSSGTLTVGYVTNLNDMPNTFVTVATIPSVSSTAGDTITVDFTGSDIPASGNICFHWTYSSSFYSCCIDDINVTVAGSGPVVVTDPTVATNAASAIAQTAATLNGAITNPDNVTITARGFEWKATGAATYTTVNLTGNSNTLTHNLTGLTANTGYTYRAFITFNGNTVRGNDVSFTTLNEDQQPCNAPTNLQVTNITQTSATMTWNAGGSEISWKVGYKLSTASQWQEANVQQPTYTIEGLTANSTYDVRVKAVCAANNESDFVSTTFTTTGVGIDNITLANSISLMPNPADNYIELRVNSNVEVKEAMVFNAFGQLIQTVELNDNHVRIDLSNMASGMYFVRVNGEGVTATKKFVRK